MEKYLLNAEPLLGYDICKQILQILKMNHISSESLYVDEQALGVDLEALPPGVLRQIYSLVRAHLEPKK